jgi:hypothetical protein
MLRGRRCFQKGGSLKLTGRDSVQVWEALFKVKFFRASNQLVPSKDRLFIKTVMGGEGGREIPEVRVFEKSESGEDVLVFSSSASAFLSKVECQLSVPVPLRPLRRVQVP